MECPHCMSDCKPEGQLLDKNDLMPFVNFFNFMRFRTLLISGGEPTEHPDFSYIVETLAEKCKPLAMVIISNGSFVEDEKRLSEVVRLMHWFQFMRLQITSIKGLYKNYDSIYKKKEYIRSFFPGRVIFEMERIMMMRPLGRAATNPEIMKMVEQTNDGYTDCVNATLLSMQSPNIKEFHDRRSYPVPKKSTCIVLPESVGQFIGRKDNKLTNIFDGDIITVNGHYPKLVKFIPERAAFCLANISDFKNQEWCDIWQQPHSSWWDEMNIEVIGNKFDNPELLKE